MEGRKEEKEGGWKIQCMPCAGRKLFCSLVSPDTHIIHPSFHPPSLLLSLPLFFSYSIARSPSQGVPAKSVGAENSGACPPEAKERERGARGERGREGGGRGRKGKQGGREGRKMVKEE